MEAKRLHSSKEKKIKRKEVLEKKKAIDEAIKAASVVKDHLASFPPFSQYARNGLCCFCSSSACATSCRLASKVSECLSVYLESSSGERLSSLMKRYIQNLLKVNMEGPYGPEWQTEEKVKRREMVAPEARYFFVRESPKASVDEISSRIEASATCAHWVGDGDPLVGFVQYRFIVEEEIPVVYVYELQLDHCVQRKGLGKFLMQLIELIARKNRMGAVLLTVQKANLSAMNFYISKLRYTISSISPSRVDPLIGVEKSYEILCKAFNLEAKAKLEENNYIGDN